MRTVSNKNKVFDRKGKAIDYSLSPMSTKKSIEQASKILKKVVYNSVMFKGDTDSVKK